MSHELIVEVPNTELLRLRLIALRAEQLFDEILPKLRTVALEDYENFVGLGILLHDHNRTQS